MDWSGPGFVIALVLITTAGWLINNLIRTRHGYAPSDDWGRAVSKDDPDGGRKLALLTSDNERLTGQIGRLEERIAVLERIAVDPATRTAREIDGLR